MDNMTHYMGLLVANHPWNLLIFMAIPVICAETLAITELIILFNKNLTGTVRKINKVTGIIAGFYFLGIFLYLWVDAIIPITAGHQWRGPADIIAVGFYISGVIPLLAISLLEINAVARKRDPLGKLKLHATFVGIFLVVAHIAMIFGMMNPGVLGYTAATM
ncbi:MAG: permease [Dehalococcoidia bacterium]|nr:permease [Dehalococcoidia bacterium]MDD5493877.1 permease [Dehalococcoidia bacterium]